MQNNEMFSSPLTRALGERDDLHSKLVALYSFSLTDEFKRLTDAAQKRLKSQAHFMESYHNILVERINKDLADQRENDHF